MTVRVLIVDDSGFFRRRLSEILSADPLISIVGVAENGAEAIKQVDKLHPDVITMDFEMPIMNGVEAVKKIMATRPTPILMLSTWSTDGAKTTLDALEAGAVDYIPKRFEDISADSDIAHKTLQHRIRKLARSKLRAQSMTTQKKTYQESPTHIKGALRLVVIGTSTGGPVALQKVLSQLPASFPYPLLLVQHMPATFTPAFAERLNAQCHINIKHAENGDTVSAGTAYLAPGGTQMLINGDTIQIDPAKSEHPYKPCIDVTLASLVEQSPSEVLAIILTGMGSDGLKGCQQLKKLNATIWTQDEQSSTIYGMPKAIVDSGIADKVLDILEIGQSLSELK